MSYEMRTGTESDQKNNEATFKAIKKTKEKDNDLDEEITNFVRRFQKESGRYILDFLICETPKRYLCHSLTILSLNC
jgi:hypothetical protein